MLGKIKILFLVVFKLRKQNDEKIDADFPPNILADFPPQILADPLSSLYQQELFLLLIINLC
jgi:hypothetical protein